MARVQVYSRDDLLLFASKLALSIDRDGGLFNPRFQLTLAKQLLSEDVFIKYARMQQISKVSSMTKGQTFRFAPIFTPIHALNFLKQVLRNHENGGTKIIHDELAPGSAQEVFQSVLGFADHIGSAQDVVSDPLLSKAQVLSELLRTNIFLHREDPPKLLGRFWKLLFDLPQRCCAEKAGDESLGQLFEKATGISMENFFAVGFGLLAKFVGASLLNYKQGEDPNANAVMEWNQYLSKSAIADDQKTKLKSLFVTSIDDARKAFTDLDADYQSKGDAVSFEHGLLPLIRRPLIEVSNGLQILSYFPFLVEKATVGIYWYIHDSMPNKQRGAFREYWGCLCQKYVEEIFRADIMERLGLSENEQIFFDPPYSKNKSDAYGTDIIVFDKRTRELFLFEVTFSTLRLEAAFQKDNLKTVSDGVDKLVGKARQIDEVIADIKSGMLQLGTIDPRRIARYRPIVVTMSPYPIWNFMWRSIPGVWTGINERLATKYEQPLLATADIAPLRIINASEMEWLGGLQRNRINILKVLRSWTTDKRWSGEALQNFLVANYPRRGDHTTMVSSYHQGGELAKHVLSLTQ
jgi:hypothetical protein